MSRLLRLTLLTPDIIEALLDGQVSEGMNLEESRRSILLLWEDQRRLCYPTPTGSVTHGG